MQRIRNFSSLIAFVFRWRRTAGRARRRGRRRGAQRTRDARRAARRALPPDRLSSRAPSRGRRQSSSTAPRDRAWQRGCSRSTRTCSSRRPTPSGGQVERRYGITVEVYEGPSLARQAAIHGDALWAVDPVPLLLDPQGRPARARARRPGRLDHGIAARAVARRAPDARRSRWDERHEPVEGEPSRRLVRRRRVELREERELPVNRSTRTATPSIGCTHCTLPGDGREGRWTGFGKTECGLHGEHDAGTQSTSPTSTSSRPRPSTSCGRWPPSSSAPCCSSRAARTRSCCSASPRRRSGPVAFPFPLMHVDTGHNFPEVIEFRDRRVAELGERLIVASRAGVDRPRPRRRADGPARVAQPAADDDAARRDGRARLRRRDRRRAARRGALAREGAHLLVPGRLRPVGSPRAAARAVEPLQREDPQGRASARLPDLELDRARRVAVRGARAARAPVHLLRPRARGVRARRHAVRGRRRVERALRPRVAVHGVGALPHGRRHVAARARVRSRAATIETSSPRSPRHASPSAARRAPTTASPRRRWRTARGSATSDG